MELKLTDSTGHSTLPPIEVPLTIATLEGAVDVQTLSYDIYTDFVTQKRTWTNTYAYLDKDQFNLIKGYYDRQFTDFVYPQLSVTGSTANDVTNIVVRMTLTPQNIIDNCETVQDVTISFRETRQLGS